MANEFSAEAYHKPDNVLLLKDRAADAAADLEQALRRDPGNPDLLLDLATTEFVRGDAPTALPTLTKALAEAREPWPQRGGAQKILEEWSR